MAQMNDGSRQNPAYRLTQ